MSLRYKGTLPKKKVVRAASRTFFWKPHFVALNFIFLVLGLQNAQDSVLAQFNLKMRAI